MNRLVSIDFSKKDSQVIPITVIGDVDKIYPGFIDDFDNITTIKKIIHLIDEQQVTFYELKKDIEDYSKREPMYFPKSTLIKINNGLKSFLGNILPFLNNIEPYYGKDVFDKIRHSFYDNYLGYRFTYELRNIMQHGKLNLSVNEDSNHNVEIIADRDDLIEKGKVVKNKVLEWFNKLPEKISVLPHINCFYNVMIEMVEALLSKTFSMDKHIRFMTNMRKYFKPNCELCIEMNIKEETKDGVTQRNMTFDYIQPQVILQNIDHCFKAKCIQRSVGKISINIDYFKS